MWMKEGGMQELAGQILNRSLAFYWNLPVSELTNSISGVP